MKYSLDQKGQGLAEYIILLLMVSVACIGIVTSLGGTIERKIEMVKNRISKMNPDNE